MLEQVRDWIASANSIVALTGAGISAESGIPTFRGEGGLWRNYRPEDLATPEAFARDPLLVWEWYDWRRQVIAKAEPNEGHKTLARMEREKAEFTLVTQNVDGLHERARSIRVLKLHGDIWRLRCTGCDSDWPERRVPLPKLPPHCRCGSMARPGVVWFGEPLPPGILLEAQHAAETAEVLLVIGTSAVVYPAASLVPFAKKSGARIVEINVDETPATPMADASFREPAGQLLPKLLR